MNNNKDPLEAVSERHHEDLPTTLTAPVKTFHAKTVQSLSDCEIPINSEFRPIQSVSEHEHEECHSSPEIEKLVSKSTLSEGPVKMNGSKKKRKRRKKALSLEGKEELCEEDSSKTMDDIHSLSEEARCKELQNNDTLDEELADLEAESNGPIVTSITSDLHFFSDTDIPCG